MDRREFLKLVAVAVTVSSLSDLAVPDAKLPAKIKYKGFDILVTDRPEMCFAQQIYWSNGKCHNGILVDRGTVDWHEMEKVIKVAIDRHIKRQVA